MKDTARRADHQRKHRGPVRAGFAMGIAVCTTCFHLTDTSGSSTQRCQCQVQFEPRYGEVDCPSGFHLCHVCGQAQVGGVSRWSWEACGRCLGVNQMIQKKYGFGLALGRHSIMNGLGIPLSASREELDAGVRELIAFSRATCELSDWGILRVRELFESVPAWSDEKLIPISDWQKKFKSTRKTSLEAFRLYYGVDLLLDLQKKVGNDA